ncbi:MAG: ribosome maturation factor RimM [Phocaeicola sp.]
MIKQDEVVKIGMFNKPHGVKGELSFTFTDDVFDRVDCEYFVCPMDNILVPFFLEEYRFRSESSALVKLAGIETSEKARMFTNVDVFFPKSLIPEEEESDDISSWGYFLGFQVTDVNHGNLGEIVGVDETTMNILFTLEGANGEIMLPAHEEFFIDIDKKNRLLTVEMPEGLLDIEG